IINDFDEHFVKKGMLSFPEGSFNAHVLRMSANEPTKQFAAQFLKEAKEFFSKLVAMRSRQLEEAK
ncbi:MAG: hypothetical protein ACJ75J_00100, partial [Cytophagaceae bacterium]